MTTKGSDIDCRTALLLTDSLQISNGVFAPPVMDGFFFHRAIDVLVLCPVTSLSSDGGAGVSCWLGSRLDCIIGLESVGISPVAILYQS